MNLLLHLQLMNAYEQLGEEELVKVEEGKIASIKQAYEERQKALEELQKAQAEEEAAKDGDESALGRQNPRGRGRSGVDGDRCTYSWRE